MPFRRLMPQSSACLAIASLFGCGSSEVKPGTIVKRPGLVPVVNVKDDDPNMLAAIQKARTTTDGFVAALNNPKPSQSGFAVKVPIKDRDRVEQMWVSPVRLVNDQFIGVINNEPLNVTTVKIGDEMKIGKGEISDWMYVENGRLIGGFTIRAIRDNMPANERQNFDRSTGLIID